ncbi:hypothetical protein KAM338_09650 [Aeromonas caviae]|nr:hypothetical protein KAM330_28590 [Aeromonas hydrophila]GKQ60788.1 hypothetical protein KAM338_09650 [Aeromonas caviae]
MDEDNCTGGSGAQKKREALGLPLLLKNTVKRYLPPSPLAGEGLGMRGNLYMQQN